MAEGKWVPGPSDSSACALEYLNQCWVPQMGKYCWSVTYLAWCFFFGGVRFIALAPSRKEREFSNKFRSLAAPRSLWRPSRFITNGTRVRPHGAFSWCGEAWRMGRRFPCPGDPGGRTTCLGSNTALLCKQAGILTLSLMHHVIAGNSPNLT